MRKTENASLMCRTKRVASLLSVRVHTTNFCPHLKFRASEKNTPGDVFQRYIGIILS